MNSIFGNISVFITSLHGSINKKIMSAFIRANNTVHSKNAKPTLLDRIQFKLVMNLIGGLSVLDFKNNKSHNIERLKKVNGDVRKLGNKELGCLNDAYRICVDLQKRLGTNNKQTPVSVYIGIYNLLFNRKDYQLMIKKVFSISKPSGTFNAVIIMHSALLYNLDRMAYKLLLDRDMVEESTDASALHSWYIHDMRFSFGASLFGPATLILDHYNKVDNIDRWFEDMVLGYKQASGKESFDDALAFFRSQEDVNIKSNTIDQKMNVVKDVLRTFNLVNATFYNTKTSTLKVKLEDVHAMYGDGKDYKSWYEEFEEDTYIDVENNLESACKKNKFKCAVTLQEKFVVISFNIPIGKQSVFGLEEFKYDPTLGGSFESKSIISYTHASTEAVWIVATVVVAFLFLIPALRIIVYKYKTTKVDYGNYLEEDAEILMCNVRVLTRKMEKTADPKEKAKLQKIIDKQMVEVEKLKAKSEKLLEYDKSEEEYIQDEYESDDTYVSQKEADGDDDTIEEDTDVLF